MNITRLAMILATTIILSVTLIGCTSAPVVAPTATVTTTHNVVTGPATSAVPVPPLPTSGPVVPTGATARCRDGTYSFSAHRRGTCSRHGGVAAWLASLPD